ncbi:MAG: hypothetical protein E6772_07625 [Dysgonomonas sp.]|nr:hypothetical protein [Dysgonomonas sp.]
MNIRTVNNKPQIYIAETEDPDTLECMEEVIQTIEKRRRKPLFSLHKTPCEMEMPINTIVS